MRLTPAFAMASIALFSFLEPLLAAPPAPPKSLAFGDPAVPPGTWEDITPPGMTNAIGVGFSPAAPDTLYVDAYPTWPPSGPTSGIYKSTDGGDHWTGPIGKDFYNFDGSRYTGPNPWSEGVSWNIAVDPTNAAVVYAMCSFFGPQGLWKSVDGGDTWRVAMSPADTNQMSADIYAIAIDPLDHTHLLVTFHSGWNGFGVDAGVAESTDSAATWIRHPPQPGWDHGHYAFFLGQTDPDQVGAVHPSTSAWILATQGDGFWRTMDAGKGWAQVSSTEEMQHGACALYRASSGSLFMGALHRLLRSDDNGLHWTDAGAPNNQDGYNAVIGDGVRMFAQTTNTGASTVGPQHFYTSLETDGSHWTEYNNQTFAPGAGWMAVDRARKIVYSASWDKLWRLVTGD